MNEKRYLGIDWGEVRIGLALGDDLVKMATPYDVVASLDDVLNVIVKEDIDEIVLGQPLRLGEGEERFHKDYLLFLEKLKKSTPIKINLSDERMSSKAADALLGDKKTKAARDAIAAMLILQGYLDSISN